VATVECVYAVPPFIISRDCESYEWIVSGESERGKEVIVRKKRIDKAIMRYINEVLSY
jgi:hypothetical protein